MKGGLLWRTYSVILAALLITIADLYYDVLNAGADLRVAEQSLASFQYSARRSEAMGEFGATLMLVGVTRNKTETLSGSVYLAISSNNIDTAMATARSV